MQLQSFTMVPDHISRSTASVKGISRGTVTLDRPAPAGSIVVKISAKSPVPNIVSFPPDITIGAGQSSAIFDVSTDQNTPSTEVFILASFDLRALAAKLTVG